VLWMFVCCKCCVCCQVEVSAAGWSLIQMSPTDCGASLCVIQKTQEWGGRPALARSATKKKSLPNQSWWFMNVSGDFDIFRTVSTTIVFVGSDAMERGRRVQMLLVNINTVLPNYTASHTRNQQPYSTSISFQIFT